MAANKDLNRLKVVLVEKSGLKASQYATPVLGLRFLRFVSIKYDRLLITQKRKECVSRFCNELLRTECLNRHL
jgi:hypothetical protein